ncbi:MAG: uracil-DNA glycosylase, partial [Rhodospirillaceae bacterium]
RLVAYREDLRAKEPNWFNAPVPAFGDLSAAVLVVGLAPGVRGANRTGRPFTGDFAGDLLYGSMLDFGMAEGEFDRRPDDGLRLKTIRVTNAVRCVPPENKPDGAEQKACRPFLVSEIAAMPNLQAILALGKIAHDAVLRTLGFKLSSAPFAHAARHQLDWPDTMLPKAASKLQLVDSYHCSRYNQNTGRLTPEMFRAVFADLAELIAS